MNSDIERMSVFFLVLSLISVICSCAAGIQSEGMRVDRLIVLKNSSIEVGVIPRLGGRVVKLNLPNGKNVLYSPPHMWSEPEKNIPPMTETRIFRAYNGHIVWLGPQEDWWKQQDVTDKHWKVWPPDPYLVYGDYKIETQTDSYIKMTGPDSLYTGVRLVKEIKLQDDGSVTFKVTAVNIRNENVSWDLWSNTRCNGFSPSYAPIGKNAFRIDPIQEKNRDTQVHMPHKVVDGWFAFMPSENIPEGKKSMVAKMFSYLDKGVIAAFTKGGCFLKQADLVPEGDIHPKQAFCEIYNQVSRDGKSNLLELEMHGEYRTLKPGEKMSFEETWRVLPYNGENTPEAHISFLKKTLEK